MKESKTKLSTVLREGQYTGAVLLERERTKRKVISLSRGKGPLRDAGVPYDSDAQGPKFLV